MNQLTQQQKTQFLSELSSQFKYVLAYHSEFIRHLTIFKRIVSLNVFFLFVVGAIIITVNTGLFILQPSIEQLPLLLVSIQYTTEIYCFCTMFQKLDDENNQLRQYVYALDWIHSLDGLISEDDRRYCKIIYKNTLMMLAQVNDGIALNAGGMFSVDLKTFTDLMSNVYSLLTLMMRTMRT
ncbi:putative odorant receptor 71a [Aedes albopictus]|uniref:Odorant receptor n=1 Tax=Aedes albopictus TaxID=7160 RepID=A0ABM1XZQ6_AEDAL